MGRNQAVPEALAFLKQKVDHALDMGFIHATQYIVQDQNRALGSLSLALARKMHRPRVSICESLK